MFEKLEQLSEAEGRVPTMKRDLSVMDDRLSAALQQLSGTDTYIYKSVQVQGKILEEMESDLGQIREELANIDSDLGARRAIHGRMSRRLEEVEKLGFSLSREMCLMPSGFTSSRLKAMRRDTDQVGNRVERIDDEAVEEALSSVEEALPSVEDI